MTEEIEERYAVCATCSASYPAFNWSSDSVQASGCAATLYDTDEGKRRLSGGYGSTVCDMTQYEVIPHDHFKLGDCCDICIVEMIASGLATKTTYGFWDDTETI